MKKERGLLCSCLAFSLLIFVSGCYPDSSVVSKMSLEEARNLAENSICIAEGQLLSDAAFYNENTKTWWIELDTDYPEGCNPACVVYEETREAEINWRCTGLVEP